ncbi:MAG: cobalamin biosynthesis protein [Desulfobulbaceae bacterium]|jgi:cobalt-precorrin 5A hydrolase|nr:cobalamin biosynthesis protein [Desulfobulbaceae bacterium]
MIGLIAVTAGGRRLALRLSQTLADSELLMAADGEKLRVAALLQENWRRCDGFICVMAIGIVARAVAPILAAGGDKRHDPCIIVMDELGQYAVSFLSGHLGGGNELARRLATICGGRAVITTASDVLRLPALDLWAREQNLALESRYRMTKAQAMLVNHGFVTLYSEIPIQFLPNGFIVTDDISQANIIVSNRRIVSDALLLRPRNLVLGLGCNRGATVAELTEAVTALFDELGFSLLAVRNLASIDQKKDEQGLLEFAGFNHWPLHFFSAAALNALAATLAAKNRQLAVSPAAMQAVGAIGVAEPAAMLSAATDSLLCGKRKWKNLTLAVAQASCTLSASDPARRNI